MSSNITGTSNGPFTLFLKQKLLQKVIYLLEFSASKPLFHDYTSFATKLDSISFCQHFLPLLIKTTECASELHPYLYDIPWKVCKRFNRVLSKSSAWGNFSVSPTWSTRPMTGARSTSLWVHRNLFWQLSRDGNVHGLVMLHAMTASPKPSFKVPWRMDNTVVGRGTTGWTASKAGHISPCSQWPPAEKTGRGSLLNHFSCPPDHPISQGA